MINIYENIVFMYRLTNGKITYLYFRFHIFLFLQLHIFGSEKGKKTLSKKAN